MYVLLFIHTVCIIYTYCYCCCPSFFPICPIYPAHLSCPQSILFPLSMSMSHSNMFFD